jgi:hypothetical protein
VVVRALVAIGAWIVPDLFSSFVHTRGEGKHALCYVCLVRRGLLEALEGVLSKTDKLDQKVERTGKAGWLEEVWIQMYSVTGVCKFALPLLAVGFPWCSGGSFQAWTGILSNLSRQENGAGGRTGCWYEVRTQM